MLNLLLDVNPKEMEIGKELMNHLLMLEEDQKEKVLAYVKDMLKEDEMNLRAEKSEEAIASGEVKSFDQFNSDFENWKARKKSNTK